MGMSQRGNTQYENAIGFGPLSVAVGSYAMSKIGHRGHLIKEITNMANIRVNLESVSVTDGQGISEGDFELRVQVQEGNNNVVWPGLNTWAKVDKGGAAKTINETVGTYTVSSGTLSKRYLLAVGEEDGGVNGKDDEGQDTLTFDLTPTMAPSTKSATIKLKRPNGKEQGTVKVTMTAQRI
jgi:hypothetical protein